MAFDISLGESPPEALPPQTFEEFFAASAAQVANVLSLACNDSALTDSALTDSALAAALARASQRWSYLETHPNPIGWVIHEGLRHADKVLRNSPALSINQATGGYVRGLDLTDALAALPLQQRAAVIAGYYLGWSDEFTASGFETAVATQRTRRDRGASFLPIIFACRRLISSRCSETICRSKDHIIRCSRQSSRWCAVGAVSSRPETEWPLSCLLLL